MGRGNFSDPAVYEQHIRRSEDAAHEKVPGCRALCVSSCARTPVTTRSNVVEAVLHAPNGFYGRLGVYEYVYGLPLSITPTPFPIYVSGVLNSGKLCAG